MRDPAPSEGPLFPDALRADAGSGQQGPSEPRRQLRAHVLAALPLVGTLVGQILSLPDRASFVFYLTNDAGASLAAAVRAAGGHFDFGFPYGPLALALQRVSLTVPGDPPMGALLLGMLAGVLLGGGLALAVHRLRLGPVAALLLAISAVYMSLIIPWVPVYELEPVALALAVICWSGESAEWGLLWCVAGALIKPSMAVVLGAWFTAGVIWMEFGPRGVRGVLRRLRMPLLAGGSLLLGLGLWCGPRALLNLLSPLAGMRNHQVSGFSFFSGAGNPFAVPGIHLLRYVIGTPLALWSLATLVLAFALTGHGPIPKLGSLEWMRWFAAWGCLAATLAFVVGFYGWKYSYVEYFFLPLLGIAVLPPGRHPRLPQIGLALVVLAVFGAWTVVRADLHAWRSERSYAATAGLWATPAEAAAWEGFVAANPPASHPLFLLDAGAPEAIFPDFGPPWHAYAVAGEATPFELAALSRRLAAASCVAYRPGRLVVSAAQVAAIQARQPQGQVADLFKTFGCASGAR